jgi:UDP-glucose 4-epimerase
MTKTVVPPAVVTVFGGSGFLGSHVGDELTRRGYRVRLFDRVASRWKLAEQEMIVGDLLDADAVTQAVVGSRAVYNFAALADLNQALDRAIDTVRVNVLGNAHVLEACRQAGVARFLYASTVYVHSREGGFYRCSKQAAEQYVEEYQRTFGLDFTILRYGSLYGPRADQTNGLFRLVREALRTGTISYQGNPEAIREYIHVEDAALASVAALGDEFRNESVMLTGSQPMRVLDLLKMLAEILGKPDAVNFRDEDYVGHYVRTPYADRPRVGRKYVPPMHVDLGQGLLQLIEDIRRSDDGKN